MTNLPPFDRWGSADRPTLILIHGASLSRRMWVPAAERLAPDFQVLGPDLPGHGHRTDPFSLDQAADEVAALIRGECPAGAFVAGDSLGGYTTLAVASRYPELVKGAVVSGATYRFDRRPFRTRLGASCETLLVSLLGARMLGRVLKRVGEVYPKAPLDDITAGGIRLAVRPEALRELAAHDTLAMVPRYPGPILFVNGEDDAVARRHEAAFVAAARQATLVVMPGLPHGVSLAEPLLFADQVGTFARRIAETC